MSLLRRPTAWVFLILMASFGYFWQSRDWNTASRLMLTYAIIDRGTIRIDGLQRQTGDIARYRDHYYTDKTPGFSLMAVPPAAVAKLALRQPNHPLGLEGFAYWPVDYWATLGTSGLCTALAGVVLVILARDLGCGPRRSAMVGLAYGLGTPAYAYATLAYGHQLASFCLIASFALLWRDGVRPRLQTAMAGFFASYASVVEIQVGPVSAILGFYLLSLAIGRKRPGSCVLTFGLGALIPALILMGYNQLAFEGPTRMGYFYLVTERFAAVHSADNPLGLARPDWARLGELIWGERRGLLWYAPIVALTVPGLVATSVRKLWGMVIVSTLTMVAIFLVNLSYPEWTGGWTTGPRLLVPLLPFAMLPVAGLLAVGGRWSTALAVGLAVAGGVVILMFVGIGGRIPDWIDRPMVQGVVPLWQGDKPLPFWVYGHRFARNPVALIAPVFVRSLPSWAASIQFLPLVMFQVGAIAVMTRSLKPTGIGSTRLPSSGRDASTVR